MTTVKLMAVTRSSQRGSSLRITLPKEVAEYLNIDEGDHVGFYMKNNEIVVRKIE
ncbi:AbrB/MazE/SpoVT family DNA-binding domain-containing protein [Oxyplasma meridianum]|uniref:AbrB/MazE/SpoVT family DNA-binding domain-containing protein n=1 Tax=Oxyplasma meridianum TaxID=3073602 RepID=A0AAX4NIN1_9ARCH